jgi:hypothetical protein
MFILCFYFMLLFIANNWILFFCISILNMRRNGHIFLIRICKRAESTMLYLTCACPCCREVFNAQGRFFDKNGSLAEFPQLCLYERFDIWTVNSIDVLRNKVNIEYWWSTLWILLWINYLAIELIDVVNIGFNSSDVVVNNVMNVVCEVNVFWIWKLYMFYSKFKYFLNLYRIYWCWLT